MCLHPPWLLVRLAAGDSEWQTVGLALWVWPSPSEPSEALESPRSRFPRWNAKPVTGISEPVLGLTKGDRGALSELAAGNGEGAPRAGRMRAAEMF